MIKLEDMYQGMPFSPDTYLTKAINEADTEIYINDEAVFPPAPNIATIGNDKDGEVIKYTSLFKGVLSGCTRGLVGTPKSWAINSVIARNYSSEDQRIFIKNILALEENKVNKVENKDLIEISEIEKLEKIEIDNESKITNDITGNAATATKLKTSVNIFGLPFDGSKNIEEDNNHKLVTNAEKIIIREVSNPNLLINGDFQVWQRGTEFIIPNRRYTADRWQVQSTNGGIAGNGIKKNANGMEAMGCTQLLRYFMEESNLKEIAGKKVTLSWSLNGKISSKTFICPSKNNIFDVGIGPSQILNWVKLELGEVATPFVPRPYAEELVLCQRYCQAYSGVDIHLRTTYPTAGAGFNFLLPIKMRVCPSIKWVGTANVDYRIYDILCSNPQIDFSGFTLSGHSNNEHIDIWTIKSNHGLTNMVLRIEKTGSLILDAEMY